MISKLEGIVITETPYGENSKIVNILTKEKGLVGLEGKEYVVKDGDVILFRFNV